MESGHHIISLSLGGPAKPSGLAVLEPRSVYWHPKGNESELDYENHFDVVWLQRFGVGYTFPAIVARVREAASEKQLMRGSTLLVDITNTGEPPLRLFRDQGLYPEPFRVTGAGESAYRDDGTQVLSTQDMRSAALVALQSDRIEVADDLELGPTLLTDLQAYDPNAKDQLVDLVSAVAVAVWWGERLAWSDDVAARMLPEEEEDETGRCATTGY